MDRDGRAVASGIVATVFGVRSQREVGSRGLTRQQAVREVESRERDVTRSYISLGAVGVSAVIGAVVFSCPIRSLMT